MSSSDEPIFPSASEIAFEGYDPKDERRRESLLGLGNGMLFLRSSPCEASIDDDSHYQGLYRAGCYSRRDLPIDGKRLGHDSLVNLPSCLLLSFRIGDAGDWFSLANQTVLSWRQALDMNRGVATRDALFADAAGRRTRLREERLVSMARPSVVALRLSLTAENWSGRLDLRGSINGCVRNQNTDHKLLKGYRHIDVTGIHTPDDEMLMLTARTLQSGITVAIATRTRADAPSRRTPAPDGDFVAAVLAVEMEEGRTLAVETLAAVVTERDPAVADPVEAALAVCSTAPDFAALAWEQERSWARLWRRAAITADNVALARAATVHAFHLLQTVSPHSTQVDVGLPSRGWQEAYHGQIFWDEIFAFPFLNLRFPEIARALLMYRYRRLPAARRAAQAAGFRGAMYPWRSATTGEEETPLYQLNPLSEHWMADATRRQRHIGAAVAHNVWRYFLATGDASFMAEYGTEMLVEIARFWASLAEHDAADDRYDIRGVIGPDEYHSAYPGAAEPGIDNNSYTNVMAAFTLRHAAAALDLLPPERRDELMDALALGEDERAVWPRIASRLRLRFNDDGVISQFEGFDRLKAFDCAGFSRDNPDGRVDWVLEARGDSVNSYQATKQADVLMLLYLHTPDELAAMIASMGYEVGIADLRRALRYYLDRVTHESSLSHAVCAGALARFDEAESWRFYEKSLRIDLDAAGGASAEEGLHLGSMAATFDVLQRHYLGLRIEPDALVLEPLPPDALGPVDMRIAYRGALLQLKWDGEAVALRSDARNCGAIAVRLHGETRTLAPGGELRLERANFPPPLSLDQGATESAAAIAGRSDAAQEV